MLAMTVMSTGATAFFYVVAFIAFLVATILAVATQPRNLWAVFVAAGLTLWFLVVAYNAVAVA